jgi:hypothetical protein
MKKKIVLFLIITLISCEEKEKYSDQKVCSLLSKMYEEDQKTRNLPEFIQYSLEFSEMLDSIKLKKNLTDKQFNSLDENKQNELRDSVKNLLDNRFETNWDSLVKRQNQVDEKNTKILIDIISYKGWPNTDSLNCVKGGPPVLIFRHAPEKYFDTIRTIIEKEYKEKRMAFNNYWFIDNHLQGRPPMFNDVETTK